MSRLQFVIAYTHDMERAKPFYRDHVGLRPALDGPFFTSFGTRGATLALLAVPPHVGREVELCFVVDDVDAHVARLRARQVEFLDELRDQEFGRVIHLRDPDGNLLSFLTPRAPFPAGSGEAGLFVMLNSDEPGALASFYRDRLGFDVASESPHWLELATGGTRLAIHTRPADGAHPAHAHRRLAYGLEVGDLGAAADAMRARGLQFSSAPASEEFGVYAEAFDGDGNLVVFRESAPLATAAVAVAEAFEDEDAPRRAAIRRPVRKSSKAVSRLAIKPAYGAKKRARKKSASPSRAPGRRLKETRGVAAPRGTGPAGTRAKPKRQRDAKRAKAKPAVGRLKKAERRVVQRKKRATARASKGRPIKRAAARRGKGR